MEEKEDFMTKYWRPLMAMTYMATCLFDFILGPILYNILQYYNPGQHVEMWVPLTLQGGGLYHIAMGVVLGVSAHGRTQEKINAPSIPGMGSFLPLQQEQAPAPVYAAPAPAPELVPAPEPVPAAAPVRRRKAAAGPAVGPDQAL